MFSILRKSSAETLEKGSKNKQQRSSTANIEKQKFAGSPLFNVLLVVALGFGIIGFFRFLEWRRMNAQTQIQLNDSETATDGQKAGNKDKRLPAPIFAGEVFDTSSRLREIGAFGFAACLSVVDEAKTKKQIPGSIEALVKSVVSRDLMPPGLDVKNGEISSATSRIYIRYQPVPLELEFVSIPRDVQFGPALLLRFPLTTDGKNITYFQAAKLENINLPKAFAPDEEIIHSGWTLEAWRGSEIGGETQDFARRLMEEKELLLTNAPTGNNLQSSH